MDADHPAGDRTESGPPLSSTNQRIFGRKGPPSINLTASLNLLKFQVEIKAFAKGSFEFHNTGNGIRVVAK
jgi:hypothetical protein